MNKCHVTGGRLFLEDGKYVYLHPKNNHPLWTSAIPKQIEPLTSAWSHLKRVLTTFQNSVICFWSIHVSKFVFFRCGYILNSKIVFVITRRSVTSGMNTDLPLRTFYSDFER